MPEFSIKKGDTAPGLGATLRDSNDDPIDLTNASSVQFHMVDSNDTVVVDSSASITNASEGKVTYFWSSGDTDTAGSYRAEFEITFNDGDIETVPNNDDIDVTIREDLA